MPHAHQWGRLYDRRSVQRVLGDLGLHPVVANDGHEVWKGRGVTVKLPNPGTAGHRIGAGWFRSVRINLERAGIVDRQRFKRLLEEADA